MLMACRKLLKNEFLSKWFYNRIEVQFNPNALSRQFERLSKLLKRDFHKVIGNVNLTFEELEDTFLKVEVARSRPLSYLEDDVDSTPC